MLMHELLIIIFISPPNYLIKIYKQLIIIVYKLLNSCKNTCVKLSVEENINSSSWLQTLITLSTFSWTNVLRNVVVERKANKQMVSFMSNRISDYKKSEFLFLLS